MPTRTRSKDEKPPRLSGVSRRRFLGGSAAATATAVLGVPAVADAGTPAPASTWEQYQCADCGASVQYPSNWMLDTDFGTGLLSPLQAFAVRTGARPPEDTSSGLPDLSGYPGDGAVLWLLYYQQIFTTDPTFSGLTLSQLTESPAPGCPNLVLYTSGFAGSSRSFLLQAYAGRNASTAMQGALAQVVSSISVP
jgi:hypothetical protein